MEHIFLVTNIRLVSQSRPESDRRELICLTLTISFSLLPNRMRIENRYIDMVAITQKQHQVTGLFIVK